MWLMLEVSQLAEQHNLALKSSPILAVAFCLSHNFALLLKEIVMGNKTLNSHTCSFT